MQQENLKDAGFKVTYHTMPGLPFTTPEEDFESYERMFSDVDFKPDMLKIYPCLVVKVQNCTSCTSKESTSH